MKRAWAVVMTALMLQTGCGESVPETAVAEQDADVVPGESVGPTTVWPVEWRYSDGSCQDTRTRVLVENTVDLVTWADPEACELASGGWQSWGRDMVMPLHLAWVVPIISPGHAEKHGAVNWSREQKVAFLNDRDNLIILDPVSTQERADFGPDKWVPLEAYWCEYAQRWQRVKERYGLSVEEAERAALAHMLGTCAAE